MDSKISPLFIISSYNIYGGTPKKTLDLLNHFKEDCSMYSYSDQYSEHKHLFTETGAHIYEGNFRRNIYLHIKSLLHIIDTRNINIIQAQFTMGEVLCYIIKKMRPHIRIVIAFVGPFKPSILKKIMVSYIYRKMDAFVFISNYVKLEKCCQFPHLNKKLTKIIFNGTKPKQETSESFPTLHNTAILDTAGLVDWKNINILIEAMNIIINIRKHKNIFLYVAGDGPDRESLNLKISEYHLENNINLLGYQKNIVGLLNKCDIFVHPAYKEGFGIAVIEAMMAGKPTIVANAGALPELVEDQESGLIVEPFDANQWADSIIQLSQDKEKANLLSENAKTRAHNKFSTEKFIQNYDDFYHEILL